MSSPQQQTELSDNTAQLKSEPCVSTLLASGVDDFNAHRRRAASSRA